jgi:hypothetical protein
MEENIFQAHTRIYKKLIFMVSCYDPEYAIKYITNLNNKTFKHFFKVYKLDNPDKINEMFDKLSDDEKQIIFVTNLPVPELYSFNFIKDVYHIHIAVPLWNNLHKDEYDKYTSDIKNISVQKFINVHDKKKIYNNKIEDRLFDMMVELIDRKLNGRPVDKESEKFKRMPQDGGKIILFSTRDLN